MERNRFGGESERWREIDLGPRERNRLGVGEREVDCAYIAVTCLTVTESTI